MITSGNFAELLWPGIAEIWGDVYNDYAPLYEKVYEMKKSDKRFEKEQGVTGFALVGVKTEGNSIPFSDPLQGYQKEYTESTYAMGVAISRELAEDEQYNYINSIPKKLARSLRQTEETLAWNTFNNGFSSSYLGADGVALFSSSHNLVGGGTYRNQLSTTSDLTQTTIEQMMQDISDLVDDQSLKINLRPRCLVVPTQVQFRARKIIESPYVTGSNDNDKNPIPGILSDLIVSPWLTDNDAWFIVTDCDDGLTWYDRRAAEIIRDNEFDTQNLKIATTKRFSLGWTNPRGVFGTAGA